MNLFYAHPEDISFSDIVLRGQESKHAAKVMRLSSGDEVKITDGKGCLYHAVITAVNKENLIARIDGSEAEEREMPFVTLVLGIIKKRDRLEFALEKCVELGADRVIIFKGDHSEKQNVRADRAKAVILSAMKQSLRVYLPDVSISESLKDGIESIIEPGTIILADEMKREPETELQADDHYIIVVGPEGGFSESEREFLTEKGARPYSLGKKRLRTETAAVSMVDRFKSIGQGISK